MEPEHAVVVTEIREEVLSERLAAGPLPVQEALQYAIDIASTLQRLHDGGHTYGTITASNIVILGAQAGVQPPATEDSADPREDIPSFGALLYHMLTGTTLGTEWADELSFSMLPDDLQHVIATCLEPNCNRRYQRMRTVVMELKLRGFAALREKAASSQETILRDTIARLEQRIEETRAAFQSFQEQVESLVGSILVEVRSELDNNRNAVRAMESGVCQNEALLSRTLAELEVLQERVLAA